MSGERLNHKRRVQLAAPLFSLCTCLLMLVCYVCQWGIAFNVVAIVLIAIVIWQAANPFSDAAQWIGNRLHLPGSVRGATLDAIASSLPELFTGLFFVIAATSAASDVAAAEAAGKGYGATVATCAGSAVYNMILIPASVALIISFRRRERPTVDVEDKVIARDGLAFLACEVLLLVFLFFNQLHWWMGLLFILAYALYVRLLYVDWKVFDRIKTVINQGDDSTPAEVQSRLAMAGEQVNISLIEQATIELKRREESQQVADSQQAVARSLFGCLKIRLTVPTAVGTILISAGFAAFACYFLVDVTEKLASLLGVPTFFMAVIVTAAASSLPDTLLSLGAASRGDDSGAVSNAFGSNIFDICVCLSIPLILSCGLNGWRPISLLENGQPIQGLVGLRVLLGVFSVITLGVMWHRRQLNRAKAIFLILLYVVFVGYAVLGSVGLIDV